MNYIAVYLVNAWNYNIMHEEVEFQVSNVQLPQLLPEIQDLLPLPSSQDHPAESEKCKTLYPWIELQG